METFKPKMPKNNYNIEWSSNTSLMEYNIIVHFKYLLFLKCFR